MEGGTRPAVLGTCIDAVTWNEALRRIVGWAEGRESRYICVCNVHSLVTAQHDPAFRGAVHGADMVTPDGMPVAWALRALGFRRQERIDGPDLMWKLCARMAELRMSVYLYGSSERTLAALRETLDAAFPTLEVAGVTSPPFRPASAAEDLADLTAINGSGSHIVFVSLGCPKQEKWMAVHRGQISAVMIGVGAAFDYHAGTLRRAPPWMRRAGLEWLYRLMREPRRLWKRYLVTNVAFVAGFTIQWLRMAVAARARK